MADELHGMGVRVMVSVRPSVDRRSENYPETAGRGMLIRTGRGSAKT
jgi:alpha-D-xyloside xylohydrolase